MEEMSPESSDGNAFGVEYEVRRDENGHIDTVILDGFENRRVHTEPAHPKQLTLRDYQEELVEAAVEGRNCIVVAPTGSGKTHVALKAIKEHLANKHSGTIRRVAFLVCQVELANQQGKLCAEYLEDTRIKTMTGGTQNVDKVSLHLLLPTCDVMVITAQVLVESIRHPDETTTINDFTLLVFDECHHTTKEHPYNVLMNYYFDEKFGRNGEHRRLPQVLGLTASVGVGKAKGEIGVAEHIKRLCANLDVERICTVQNQQVELQKFMSTPTENVIPIMNRVEDPFAVTLQRFMNDVERRMRRRQKSSEDKQIMKMAQLSAPPSAKTAQAYINWLSTNENILAQLADQDERRFFVVCNQYLKIYHDTLVLNEDCRTVDALYLLKHEMGYKNEKLFTDTESDLMQDFTDEIQLLEEYSRDDSYPNPKLQKLRERLIKIFDDKPDSRAIVFAKTRALVTALHRWMSETPILKDLSPTMLTGQAQTMAGGMTSSKKVNVLQYFKDGDHKIMVATSVAEEGLDIRACNEVIRYDHLTDVISKVQSRGRSRAEDGSFTVLAGPNSDTARKAERSIIQEGMMDRVIRKIQLEQERDPHKFRKELEHLQREAKEHRDHAAVVKSTRARDQGVFELRCFECNNFGCMTDDIRLAADMLRVVVDQTFLDRCHVSTCNSPTAFARDIEKAAWIRCNKCDHPWGIIAIYKGGYYPVVKIEGFVVIQDNVSQGRTKKWKDVIFEVTKLTSADMTESLSLDRLVEHGLLRV